MTDERRMAETTAGAAAVASAIIDRADRDIAFVVRFIGESQYLLARHFQAFVEVELGKCGINYGDHPFLRLFVEAHAAELAEFVVSGVSLTHQFGLQTFERTAGDPMRLLRADIWDSLRSHIENAEAHFVTDVGGLRKILEEIRSFPKPVGSTANG